MARLRLEFWLGALLFVGCDDGRPSRDGSATDGDADSGSDVSSDTEAMTGAGQWAEGIHIVRLEANQGAAAEIFRNGDEVAPGSRAVELVQGRPALIRAYWTRDDNWQNRDILAYLSLERPDGSVEPLRDNKFVNGPSDPETLDESFTWLLEANQVSAGTRYFIELKETASSGLGSALPDLGARVPLDGSIDLGVVDAPMVLKMVLVPLSPPGGSAVPVTNDDRADIEEALMELSPVQSVEVDWGSPTPQSDIYESRRDAWNDVYDLRDQLGLGPDQYLHVLLNPGGCCTDGEFSFTGAAGDPPGDSRSDEDARGRSALIMVEADVGSSAMSIVHELGHNQGLSHAPCRVVTDIDESYPYEDGVLGSQGYGIVSGELHSADPNIDHPYYDVMSYCWPVWYSDYNFERIRRRIQTLSSWGE